MDDAFGHYPVKIYQDRTSLALETHQGSYGDHRCGHLPRSRVELSQYL